MSEQSGPLAQRAAELAWSTADAMRQGRFADARVSCEEALRLHGEAGSPRGTASVRTTLGRLHLQLGDLLGAEEVLREALAAHDREGDLRLVALTERYLSEVVLERGNVDGAMALLRRPLEIFARTKAGNLEGDAQLQLAAAYHSAGDLESALQLAALVRTVGQGIHDQGLVGAALLRIALIQMELGRRPVAVDLLDEAREAFAQVDDVPGRLAVVHLHLRVDLELGRPDPKAARALVDHLSAGGDPWSVGSAASTLGAHHAQAGQLAEARAVFADAAVLLAHHPLRSAEVTLDEGLLDLAMGDRRAALARLGAVSDESLSSVSVRLRLRALRHLASK